MVGRTGPTPKPDDRRVNRKTRPELHVVGGLVRAPQPALPPEADYWPEITWDWWEMWKDSPLTADFTQEEWTELLSTARVHAEFWGGNMKYAAELRQRTAKYGLTPEDRLRLRIQFAFADTAEEKAQEARERKIARANSARARRGPLKDSG